MRSGNVGRFLLFLLTNHLIDSRSSDKRHFLSYAAKMWLSPGKKVAFTLFEPSLI